MVWLTHSRDRMLHIIVISPVVPLPIFNYNETMNASDPYLISTGELAGLLGNPDVDLVDVRDPLEYAQGHLPGAVNIRELFGYLVTRENGGYAALRDYFGRLFGRRGLSLQHQIVVYEDAMDNNYAVSCRGWFILKHLGHPRVRVLHGGYQAWLQEGLPVTIESGERKATEFTVVPDHQIIVTVEEMKASLTDPGIVKLDCRDRAEWVGFSSSPYGPDFAPRKGRIPGAHWIEWYRLLRQDKGIPWLRDTTELVELFTSAGISPDRPVYCYCFKGARTSLLMIALLQAGFQQVRNYLGSWNEWSRIPDLPIEKGYPRLRPDQL